MGHSLPTVLGAVFGGKGLGPSARGGVGLRPTEGGFRLRAKRYGETSTKLKSEVGRYDRYRGALRAEG